MELPNKIEFKTISFSDGVGGWAQQRYYNEQFGIWRVSTRLNREVPFKVEFTVESLPDMTFTSLKQIQAFYDGQEAI